MPLASSGTVTILGQVSILGSGRNRSPRAFYPGSFKILINLGFICSGGVKAGQAEFVRHIWDETNLAVDLMSSSV